MIKTEIICGEKILFDIENKIVKAEFEFNNKKYMKVVNIKDFYDKSITIKDTICSFKKSAENTIKKLKGIK